jgi:hypothetical protein
MIVMRSRLLRHCNRASLSAASIKRNLNAPPKQRHKRKEANQKPREPFHAETLSAFEMSCIR